MNRSTLHALTVLIITALGSVASADETLSRLDRATLIEVLAKEGMHELLMHLVETEPADDPVIDALVKVAQFRIQYTDPNLSRDGQLAAFDHLLDTYRQLIREHDQHEQRPLWQTDLAELLLFDSLGVIHRNAAEFYELGLPDDDQRQAFESVAVEALELLADADLRFFHLEADLAREPDHIAKRVNTGLWDRMINQYYRNKTQYLLAHAAYAVGLLNEDHPYYQHLDNPQIPRQQKRPDQERKRLLAMAIEKLSDFVAEDNEAASIRSSAHGLMGRALLRQRGHSDEAIEHLDIVIQEENQDLTDLVCKLAKAQALDNQDRHIEARQLLAELDDHPIVQENLLYRLLTADLAHRLKLAQALSLPASQQPAAIAKAYQPYEQLMDDPALGDKAQGLRDYIYNRWAWMFDAERLPPSPPPRVMSAVSNVARTLGQNLALDAERAANQDQPDLAEERYTQAQPHLQRTIDISTRLLSRSDLGPRLTAETMLNLGLAKFYLARGDTTQQLQAADVWTQLAQEHPDQPDAERAITYATDVLHQLYDLSPRPEPVAEAYEKTIGVLFEHFPASPAADNERVYYAYHALAANGRYTQAILQFEKVPPDHPTYYQARRETLLCLAKLLGQADKAGDQQSLEQQLTDSATRLIEETREALSPSAQTEPDQAGLIRSVQGWARLVLIELDIRHGDTTRALDQLQGMIGQYPDDPDLARDILAKTTIANAQSGQFSQAVASAKQMVDMFPEAGASVIDGLLTDLDQRIETLRRRERQVLVPQLKSELNDRIVSLARSSELLARMLLDWAVQQQFTDDQLLAYQLLLVKSLRLAGKSQGALTYMGPLLEKYADVPDVLFHAGEALYEVGGRENLVKAGNQYFDTLIRGLEGRQEPDLKKLWWHAWMRRLQIMDLLGQSPEEIPLFVRTLKLTDKNLGGDPYRSELTRLELKHSR